MIQKILIVTACISFWAANALSVEKEEAFAASVNETISAKTQAAKPATGAALQFMTAAATAGRNYRFLGFQSAAEAKTATLGEPILIYDVSIDRLRAFTATSDASTLLVAANRLIYPVYAHETVRSSITLANVDGKWTYVASGRPNLAAVTFAIREADAAKVGVARSSYFKVSVPALNFEFLGRSNGKDLLLIPVRDYQTLAMSSDHAYPAELVFTRLAAAARVTSGPFN